MKQACANVLLELAREDFAHHCGALGEGAHALRVREALKYVLGPCVELLRHLQLPPALGAAALPFWLLRLWGVFCAWSDIALFQNGDVEIIGTSFVRGTTMP